MSTRALLSQFAGGGGGGSRNDFFKIETGKQATIRLFRFPSGPARLDGSREKLLCTTRYIHFQGPGQRPLDCGQGTCEICRKVALLEASGTKEAKDKANQMRVTAQACFTLVDVSNPIKFQLWDAGFSVAQQMFLWISRAGGWTEAYPDRKTMEGLSKEQQAMKLAEFDKAFEDGIPKVSGPGGRDFLITWTKGKGTKSWDVFMRMDGNKALPFLEDDDVPNPEEKRLAMAMARENNGKEGD